MRKTTQPSLNHDFIFDTILDIYQGELHEKRILLLANSVEGAITSASLAIHAIGYGLAVAQGTCSKHAIKQVDRMLSNDSISVNDFFARWISYHTRGRKNLLVAMDWTDFARDDQTVLSLQLLTGRGRAISLLWKTHKKSSLKTKQRAYELELLSVLKNYIHQDIEVIIVADRGFSSVLLFKDIDKLGFYYAIRFKGNVYVADNQGESLTAKKWLNQIGQAKLLRNAKLTKQSYEIKTVVCYQEDKMKSGWFIASNHEKLTAYQLINYYGQRWSLECTFRDIKNNRYGFGLENVRTESADRRDKLLMVAALAMTLLMLLGIAGESIGYDRFLKANTSKKRTLSLIRQGLLWYDSIPNMPEERLMPLIQAFNSIIDNQDLFQNIFHYEK